MVQFSMVIVLIFSILCVGSCFPRRIKNKTSNAFISNTGEAIAIDYLLQKYEREHKIFYKKETDNGSHMMWPDLDHKNLTNYCIEYLQHSLPTRTSKDVTGTKIKGTLNYKNETINSISEIVVVHCKIVRHYSLSYYITRAHNPNCVYSLRCIGVWRQYTFIIINKYCDFEVKGLTKLSLKQKLVTVINQMHRKTGQPIAKDKCLLEYELEHRELVNKEGEEGKWVNWLYAMTHQNLNFYCYQYMEECVPTRNRLGVTGSLKTVIVKYQKLNTHEDIKVVTVACHPSDASRLQYHVTRATETNCVYALLRNGHNACSPFIIIFKHCDFENENDQKATFENDDILDKNVILKTEVNEGILDTSKTLQLFLED